VLSWRRARRSSPDCSDNRWSGSVSRQRNVGANRNRASTGPTSPRPNIAWPGGCPVDPSKCYRLRWLIASFVTPSTMRRSISRHFTTVMRAASPVPGTSGRSTEEGGREVSASAARLPRRRPRLEFAVDRITLLGYRKMTCKSRALSSLSRCGSVAAVTAQIWTLVYCCLWSAVARTADTRQYHWLHILS